ncbi:MAG TPA: hypothetical protein VFV38_17835 [Ktedonobacteraceae bacterium]|nr:hypothetical protein [Ktedonobacteraceae bacterium]
MNQSFPAGVGKSAIATRKSHADISRWKRALHFWYSITAPSETGLQRDFESREAFRRGRLTSLALFILVSLTTFYVTVNIIHRHNDWLAFLAAEAVNLALATGAAMLNRRGHLLGAVCLLVVIFDGGLAAALLFVKGGLGLINLPVFDLLIGSELIVVSLLGPFSVFLMALLNSILVILLALYTHHNPDLAHYAIRSGMGMAMIIARPILVQFGVAVVTALWVESALRALKRADQAETVAALEHAIAEYERSQAAQKRSLEQGIQYLVDTQRQVANGNLNARVPITQDNVLWPVAISFNNLLTRFQHVQKDAEQLQQLYREMPRLVNAIRDAKRSRRSVALTRGGTLLDALIVELTS